MDTRIGNRFQYDGDFSTKINRDTDKGRSKTAQSFAKEANINTIISKYRKTGILVDPVTAVARTPFYGDFTSSDDYFALQSKLTLVKEDFERLPGAIRSRFHQNVGEMLDFVANPANLKEACEMGLLPKEMLPKLDPKNIETSIEQLGKKPPATPEPVV